MICAFGLNSFCGQHTLEPMSWNADTDLVDNCLLSLFLTAFYRHGLFKTLQPFRNTYFSVTFKTTEKIRSIFFFFVFHFDVVHIFLSFPLSVSFSHFCFSVMAEKCAYALANVDVLIKSRLLNVALS